MAIPIRSEVTGVSAYNVPERLLSITYSPLGSETGPGALNIQDYVYNVPILIHSYEVRIATNYIGVVYQNYGDDDDTVSMDTWNTSEETFYQSLKKYRLFSGHQQTVMKFRSSWSKKHRKWLVPPIKLGTPNAGGNRISISVVNQEVDSSSREHFAITKFTYTKLD